MIKYVLSVVCTFFLVGVASATSATVEDVLGRNVQVTVPAKKVILGFYPEDYMAIGTEAAFDNVIGLSRDTWAQWRPASWNLYTQHRPSLNDIADIGDVESQTFSIEKVIALKPDVLVLADWQYKGLGFDADRIEDAGIPIVVIDYNAQTLARHIKSTLIIGQLTGQQDRARKIADEYRAAVELVTSRVAKHQGKKPRVYIEFGDKGPSEYSFTYGKNMWGAMVSLAGGDNIAAPFIQWWGPINPEKVISAKPEVVLISGTELSKSQDAMLMGQQIKRSVAQARLTGFSGRIGWSGLPAVKDQRLHGIYQGASRSILDASALQYIAKAIYPELFEDIEPEKAYLSFYKKYLPVTPQGTFFTSLNQPADSSK